MIIGSRLEGVLEGMTVDVNGIAVKVNFDYGKQAELDRFIAAMDKKGAKKFPLVYYVTNKVKDYDGKKWCRTNLLILTNTEPQWLSKKRTIETYKQVIEPLYQQIKLKFNRTKYIDFMDEYEEFMPYIDIDGYGIVAGNVGDSTSKKSVVTDYVDARKIDFELRIGEPCD